MKKYNQLVEKARELMDLQSALGLMHWDQEVNMSKGSAERRAQQVATLSGMLHDKGVNEIPPLLEAAEHEMDNSSPEIRANLREIRRDLEKSQKLPGDFVRKMSLAIASSHHVWVEAKQKADFSLFEPKLTELVALKKEEAHFYGFEENPYDALIDSYEPRMKATQIQSVFDDFLAQMGEYGHQINALPPIDDSFLKQQISSEKQLEFGNKVVAQLGYDLERGRIDISPHPFTISMGNEDVRITTMVDENDISTMLYSNIHEAGHAIYEQGLPSSGYGLPSGRYCSLSIHESQSRLYENNLGRSLEFWEYWMDEFRELFPDKLASHSFEDVFAAINKIQPHLIRIESDELNYHYHIILRFEAENALMNNEIKVSDLPAFWNEKINKYLGLKVPNDAKGVLQDIHWSHGSFGYFATYSLGSFYAAQFFEKASQEISGFRKGLNQGNFLPLKTWLNEHVHSHGKTLPANQLCVQATGEGLNVSYFVKYLKAKLNKIYGLGS